MCLEVLVLISGGVTPRQVSDRVREASGLVAACTHYQGRSAFRLSLSGTCSCDLLSENADLDTNVWELEFDHLPSLVKAVRSLATGVDGLMFVARWLDGQSEMPLSEQRCGLGELAAIIESNAVRNNVAYVVGAGS
jgi:hypothetical protein